MEKDILLSRCKAHFEYMFPRIFDKKKQNDFINACHYIITHVDDYFAVENQCKHFHEGGKMALDIYYEIMKIHRERFIDGRSGDAYLEKI